MQKLISWNIDSINAALTSASYRAQLSRNVLDTLKNENADIIAIQETKLPETGPSAKHLEILETYFPGYKVEWVSSVPPARKGYAGTMFIIRDGIEFTRRVPSLGAPDTMDQEGRILTLELENFFFVNVYTPNAGDGLKRLSERQEWDKLYAEYLHELDKEKPVISCGDYNVAHKEIDLANPKTNHMNAGFTDEEREGFSNLLGKGFVDTFRFVNGDIPEVYSWWGQRFKTSKINNTGWRIDYFIVSKSLEDRLVSADIHTEVLGSDHCPVELIIE